MLTIAGKTYKVKPTDHDIWVNKMAGSPICHECGDWLENKKAKLCENCDPTSYEAYEEAEERAKWEHYAERYEADQYQSAADDFWWR